MQDKAPTPHPAQNGFPIANTGNPVLSTTETHTTMEKSYHAKSVQRLSITQIILGASAIFLQIWDIFNGSVMSVCGTGLWTGILFIIAGSLGIYSSKTQRMCPVVAFLVMSVLASLFTAPLMILSGFSVGEAARYRHYYDEYYSSSTENDAEYMMKAMDMTTAVAALLIVISLVEALVAIISSCFACKVICCTDSNQQNTLIQGQVQYITGPDGQTQTVIVPMLNQSNLMTANPPYQLTAPVEGYQTQPLSTRKGKLPAGHGMSLGIPQLHQEKATALPHPPPYSGQTTPPPEYKEKEKVTSE